MNVSLTPELETLVREKVQSGQFVSVSEVISEALRLLKERDSMQQQRMAEMKREIAAGLAELKQGQSIPGKQVFDELRRRSQKRRQAARNETPSAIGMTYDGPLMQSIFEDFLKRREQEASDQNKVTE